jgi:stringent starvation protein B
MVDGPRPLPPKKEVALLLLKGPSVFVHLDPRKKGVVVPKNFLGQPQLVLQVGLDMAIPIKDLEVTDDGVSCTLSFARTPFWCNMPWHAVYALVGEDGRGMVWPEDVPPEVAAQQQASTLKSAPPPKAKRPRPKIARIGGDPSPGSEPPESTDEPSVPPAVAEEAPAPPRPVEAPTPAGAPKRKRELPPYLRVIK